MSAQVSQAPEDSLVALFRALGDPTRWALLGRLARDPASASALADEFPVSRQALAKHLAQLREAGAVRASREGKELVYSVRRDTLEGIGGALQAVADGWDRRLDDIRRALED